MRWKINADIAPVIALPDVQQRLALQGVLFKANNADAFNAMLASDARRYKSLFGEAAP